MIHAVNDYFADLDKSFSKNGVIALEHYCAKCIELKGEMLCYIFIYITYQTNLVNECRKSLKQHLDLCTISTYFWRKSIDIGEIIFSIPLGIGLCG